MEPVPFQGLDPSPGTDHSRWIVEAMTDRDGVAQVIPDGFDAYARLLHPLDGGHGWSVVAPAYLADGTEPYPYPFPDAVERAAGDMGAPLVDALVPVLASSTTTPEHCHYALWSGWGELHPGSSGLLYASATRRTPLAALRARRESRRLQDAVRRAHAPLYAFVAACAVQPWWGGRDMLLFDGPLRGVTAIGSPVPFDRRLRRRGPQWWWPEDRSWFVATEIDYPWSYVAGTSALIGSLVGDSTLEAVRVGPSSRW